MVLLPSPQKVLWNKETFSFGLDFTIFLDLSCGSSEFQAARLLKTELERNSAVYAAIEKAEADCLPYPPGLWIHRTDSNGEEYRLEITAAGVRLAGGRRGIFWGIQTLRQISRQCGNTWPGMTVLDKPYFPVRGFFHDITRGKVPTLSTLKGLADRLSFYKINQMQLYVEHTFAFRNFSEAWTGKDPLTAEDILELDGYCRGRNIELVPSLATFGHLYEILSTKTWSRYCELETDGPSPFSWYNRMAHHTLDVSNPESFRMVKDMLDQYIPLFSSGTFNIGCDETFDLGCGKSAEFVRKIGKDQAYLSFLRQLVSYVQSKGKKVQFWGDILLKTTESLQRLPDGVTCLYWNYGRSVPEKDVQAISDSKVPFLVCPGVCGWNRMMNLFENSYENIRCMAELGKKYGAQGILNTDWGDYGHINFLANSMPGMAAGAALSWNPEDKRRWPQIAEAYSVLEFGTPSKKLLEALTDLSEQQAGTWADVVCWRESKLLHLSETAQNDWGRILKMDDEKALRGFSRALELEKTLAAFPCPDSRLGDRMEYALSARGVALMNAACLALKREAYHVEQTPFAMNCGTLAVQLELWFRQFTAQWRIRNRESELFRIRETIQDLCRFLRSCKHT